MLDQSQFFNVQCVIQPPAVLGISLDVDETFLPKNFQVMGDEVRRHTQYIADLTIALHAPHEQIDDPEPIGLADDFQPLSQAFDVD